MTFVIVAFQNFKTDDLNNLVLCSLTVLRCWGIILSSRDNILEVYRCRLSTLMRRHSGQWLNGFLPRFYHQSSAIYSRSETNKDVFLAFVPKTLRCVLAFVPFTFLPQKLPSGNRALNLTMVPDFIEENLYYNCLLVTFSLIQVSTFPPSPIINLSIKQSLSHSPTHKILPLPTSAEFPGPPNHPPLRRASLGPWTWSWSGTASPWPSPHSRRRRAETRTSTAPSRPRALPCPSPPSTPSSGSSPPLRICPHGADCTWLLADTLPAEGGAGPDKAGRRRVVVPLGEEAHIDGACATLRAFGFTGCGPGADRVSGAVPDSARASPSSLSFQTPLSALPEGASAARGAAPLR